MATDQNVLIPVKLDAFVFNDQVCAGGPGKAKIAPITQPNYTFLRLDTAYLQSDIMYDVDIHNATGADSNARITDLASGKRRANRRGVYLHWTLPRIYRSGTATTNNGDKASQSLPKFPEVPVRWMIVRYIDEMSKVEPPAARTSLQPVTAWIVESNRCRTLDGPRDSYGKPTDPINLLPSNADLQVDVSPFVDASSSSGDRSILDKQAEIFIGDKTSSTDWTETETDDANSNTVDPGTKAAIDPKSRIDLRLMGSSNELFPDYQLHCANVFSIVDNFFYGKDPHGEDLFATSVRAHYSVIGWYTKSASDVIQVAEKPGDIKQGDDQPKAKYQTREERLDELNIKIKGFQDEIEPMPKYPREIADWFSRSTGDDKTLTRSICHGAMYNVQWDLATAPKNVAADKFAKLLSEKQPIAVGTTPMDAVMAYAGAHERIDGKETGRIEAALKRLEAILLSRDDGVEAHVQAADMMYNWNYLRFDGGDMYHAAASGDQSQGEGGKTTLPADKKLNLLELNRLCRLRDAAKRQLKQQQAAAFSNWWLAVTNAQKDSEIKAKVDKIQRRVDALKGTITACQIRIDKLTGTASDDASPDPNKVNDFEPGVYDPYKQQRDPTLLVGGIQSGWEVDYLLALLVRLDCQIVEPDGQDDDNWKAFFRTFVDVKLQFWMRVSVKALLREFVSMRLRRKDEDNGHPKQPSMLIERALLRPVDYRPFGNGHPHAEPPPRPVLKAEIPLYHDKLGRGLDNEPLWRDLWNDTQPWFPLFLEWEVEYTHIGLDDWRLTESKWWQSEGAKLHYNIHGKLDLARKYDKTPDKRAFSGRVLILPQPSFSLETKITQLLADTLPSELEEYLPKEEREYLVQHLKDLRYLSAPLGGFNGHLQTTDAGNHVKPSIRDPVKGTLTFMAEARRVDAGFDELKMTVMELETDVTPYGTARKPLGGQDPPSSFKPVVHGQFKLTRLNIVDKFGQVIHLLSPDPVPYRPKPEEIPRAYPCLSDWYSPEAKITATHQTVPNTVEDVLDENKPQCEFAQVPPQIGQPVRLNARWVLPHEPEISTVPAMRAIQPEEHPPFWRAANDWDSPIWGWVVVNYANYGLQFFLPSGAFYREVRIGGPSGALASPEWLPFKEPDDPDSRGGQGDGGQAARQLARLVEAVATLRGYLPAFMAMVNAASASTGTAPPSAYSEFKSALIGKPLALVNMGWSLELAEFQTESRLVNDGKVDRKLYAQPVTRKAPGPGCEKNDEYDEEYYRFPVKLGDRQRGFDGLVGYFKPKPTADLKIGDALELSTVYTHFSPTTTLFEKELQKLSSRSRSEPDVGRISPITPDNYPKLAPYYIDPFDDDSGEGIEAQTYSDISNEQLCVFGAIVDPFSPVHAWSGILPVKDLVLPNWTWQGPIDQVSAFFHAGPVLVTSDVPDFDAKRELRQGKLIPKVVDKKQPDEAVALPGGSLGQWTWLQPYMPEKEGRTSEENLEQFMPLSVDLVDEAARLERGPYTLLEGYLQMASGAVNTDK
ncbi:hypothetical protein CLCR_09438 [Cladophialophora carrionii]|uniref:Uncharacterized protein n=1 Tax=Cladophialophora carrionii TaxID=86049 RepID=A0A1C1CWC6_9EURO|nr:hypothetical protein CLCR_09438 [Cladophialophora carrionii]